MLSLDEIYQFLMDENARDIVVIHLSKSINYVDYFIVVTANSYRHLAVSWITLHLFTIKDGSSWKRRLFPRYVVTTCSLSKRVLRSILGRVKLKLAKEWQS